MPGFNALSFRHGRVAICDITKTINLPFRKKLSR